MKQWLLFCALVATITPSLQAEEVRVVEIDWDNFRHYVAAYAWIADIDFKDGDVRSLHLCAGFNAFQHYSRDPSQMARYGFEHASDPKEEIQAAAFVIAANSPPVIDKASSYVQELKQSVEYGDKTGRDRLAYARDFLWSRLSSDPDVELAARETVRRLREVTSKMVEAGLLAAGNLPSSPHGYMLGMNVILTHSETVDMVIADERFRTLEGSDARRRFFAEQFTRRIASNAGIEDEQQRTGYRDSIRESIDELLSSGGSYVLRLPR